MKLSRCSVLTVTCAFLTISFLLWPAFVLASAILGHVFSDGELLYRFTYQPKRLLISDFLEGYQRTLPYTASVALFSVLILLLFRNTVFRSILVIAVPSVVAATLAIVYLPLSLVGVLLILKVFFIFLFLYAVCAYILQSCGHA